MGVPHSFNPKVLFAWGVSLLLLYSSPNITIIAVGSGGKQGKVFITGSDQLLHGNPSMKTEVDYNERN